MKQPNKRSRNSSVGKQQCGAPIMPHVAGNVTGNEGEEYRPEQLAHQKKQHEKGRPDDQLPVDPDRFIEIERHAGLFVSARLQDHLEF